MSDPDGSIDQGNRCFRVEMHSCDPGPDLLYSAPRDHAHHVTCGSEWGFEYQAGRRMPQGKLSRYSRAKRMTVESDVL